MQIWLRATASILFISLIQSRAALGSSAVALTPAPQGSLLIQGSLSGPVTIQNSIDGATLDSGFGSIHDFPGAIPQPDDVDSVTESIESGIPSSATVTAAIGSVYTLSLASVAAGSLTAAYEPAISWLAIASSLNSQSDVSTELSVTEADSVASANVVIPEFPSAPTAPEPAAWQSLILGGCVLGGVLLRRTRKAA